MTTPPNTTPLERVARDIYECGERSSGYWNGSWEQLPEAPRAFCFALARTALQALREVDEGTVEAMERMWVGDPHLGLFSRQREGLAKTFTAAIDHILSQTHNQGSER